MKGHYHSVAQAISTLRPRRVTLLSHWEINWVDSLTKSHQGPTAHISTSQMTPSTPVPPVELCSHGTSGTPQNIQYHSRDAVAWYMKWPGSWPILHSTLQNLQLTMSKMRLVRLRASLEYQHLYRLVKWVVKMTTQTQPNSWTLCHNLISFCSTHLNLSSLTKLNKKKTLRPKYMWLHSGAP